MRDGKPSREEDAIQHDQEARIHATRSNKRKRNDRTTKTGGGAAASPPSSSSCDDDDDAAVSLCDDVTRSIFARLPARTVVASMALSKDHRRLMRCPDFRSLHCRLSPPLPRPHIAYVATAKLRRCPSSSLSGYHGFHVAGAGLNGAAAPMRSLAGPTYVSRRYVNTCNGVVLLSGGEEQPNTCVLWNPAVADEEKEVTVPVPVRDDCVILGLGYGSRSQTYKLLLSRRQTRGEADHPPPVTSRYPKELLVFTLGGAATESRALRTVLSAGIDGEISNRSLYIDGVIYLLHVYKSLILAFDVDDEKVTAIDLPGKHKHAEMYELNRDAVETVDNLRRPMSNLMELAGRPCVETCDDNGRALWLLTEDRRWEERYVSWCPTYRRNGPVIAGAWDCGGGVLVTYLHHPAGGAHRLLCVTTTNDGSPAKTFGAYLPRDMTPEWPDYAFCWGYKPTLVSPGSIVVVGNLSDEREERRRASMAHLVEALKPVNERDKRKGHKATLNTVCFMEFLARFMQNKPQDMQDLVAIPPFQSDLVLEIH